MNVYLYKSAVMGRHHRIAYLHKLIPKFFKILLGEGIHKVYHKKLGAVAELDVVYIFKSQGFVVDGSGFLHLHIILYGVAVHNHLEAAEYGDKALAAAVHNACFLKNGQQFGCQLKGFLTAFHHNVYKSEYICTMIELALNCGAYHAGYGEYGAFLGLHYRLVSGVGAHAQCAHQQLGVHFVLAVQSPGHAAEYLGKNNAAVATGALQRAERRRSSHLTYGCPFRAALYLPGSGLHCHGHISAGIAIRYGKYVQRVNMGLIFFQQGSSRKEHILQERSVYCSIIQIISSRAEQREQALCYALMLSTCMFTFATFMPVLS